MKITVEVTEQDIASGDRQTWRHPVSLAIEKYLKPNIHTTIRAYILWISDMTIDESKVEWAGNLPSEVYEFINQYYENKEPVKPFTFIVDIPNKLLR